MLKAPRCRRRATTSCAPRAAGIDSSVAHGRGATAILPPCSRGDARTPARLRRARCSVQDRSAPPSPCTTMSAGECALARRNRRIGRASEGARDRTNPKETLDDLFRPHETAAPGAGRDARGLAARRRGSAGPAGQPASLPAAPSPREPLRPPDGIRPFPTPTEAVDRELAIEEAVSIALVTQPQIRARLEDYAAAQQRVNQALSTLLPQISGFATAGRSQSPQVQLEGVGRPAGQRHRDPEQRPDRHLGLAAHLRLRQDLGRHRRRQGRGPGRPRAGRDPEGPDRPRRQGVLLHPAAVPPAGEGQRGRARPGQPEPQKRARLLRGRHAPEVGRDAGRGGRGQRPREPDPRPERGEPGADDAEHGHGDRRQHTRRGCATS